MFQFFETLTNKEFVRSQFLFKAAGANVIKKFTDERPWICSELLCSIKDYLMLCLSRGLTVIHRYIDY